MQTAPDIQLPSLPEVTLRALEACHQEDSYRKISDIVSTDTALVTRVLAVANSALYGPATQLNSIDHALLRLGTHRFQTLLLTAALRQMLLELGADQWQQLRDFWRLSLTTALTARALATLTRYPEPDQAFMLGMLHNIGELLALKTPPGETRQYYLDHQCDIAAELVRSWGLGGMAEDAMRYQQALPAEIQDAGHLVKLISLATRLALADAAGIAAAGTVFGLSEDLTLEINRRIDREVTGVAESLGIPLNDDYKPAAAQHQLKQAVLEQTLVSQVLKMSPLDELGINALAETVNSLTLITGLQALCFGRTADGLALLSGTISDIPDLNITPNPASSVLTEAYIRQTSVHLADRNPTVLDRQLLSLLRSPSLLAIPIVTKAGCPGVFVLGTDKTSAAAAERIASLFTDEVASSLVRMETGHAHTGNSLDTELAQISLRRQLHEVTNPLTIIRQYIHQLRLRLDDTDLQNDLDVIREELDRAGDLLLRISRPDMVGDNGSPAYATLNHEILTLKELLEDGLFGEENKQLTTSLSQHDTGVAASPSTIRQILINLIRNAAESLVEGGQVTIKTSAPVWQNGRTWVELEISDNGGGIPENVRNVLFSPVATSKGNGHSGLGLSIVKQLIDDMEGSIACRTGNEGTVFRMLLPTAGNKKNDND
ncbi:histidine kinase [Marinobacter lipolyticus SM19]|uniref:histidine kinase n=1 Tax=Marinobacter lipolyticus SM19 TaxID=1318628 RepID=R8AYL9_9GAMM|nr:HDOD domain-containing protein [Marinobacter lipolyticus]EON91429.1 histidine kinase [Marinobacter lipolyticus SM19]